MSAQKERDGPDETGDAQSQFVTDRKQRDWFVVWNRGETVSFVAVRPGEHLPLDLGDCR